MKKILCLLTVVTCLFFASVCFSATTEELVKILETRAENGDVDAQDLLGYAYDTGRGVKQDYIKAFEWREKAAEQGDAISQFSLGWMYANGEGVNQDYAKAKGWYKQACDNGDQRGCDQYKHLNDQGY